MENASKALLMASGVLIAVLIIGAFMYMFTSASQMFSTEKEMDELVEITAFNREYESYNKKLLRGTDLISVGNKASSNNIKYEGESDFQITIKFQIVEELTYYKVTDEDGKTSIKNKTGKLLANAQYKYIEKSGNNIIVTKVDSGEKIILDEEAFTDLKRRVFNCIDTKYHKNTGRIYEMTFKEQKIDYTEGL